LQEVVGVVRAQLVGLLDGLKAGGLMEGHSWLQEAAAAAADNEVGLLTCPLLCCQADGKSMCAFELVLCM
jgi:uncharacterized protein YgfB (UPF0149 family)